MENQTQQMAESGITAVAFGGPVEVIAPNVGLIGTTVNLAEEAAKTELADTIAGFKSELAGMRGRLIAAEDEIRNLRLNLAAHKAAQQVKAELEISRVQVTPKAVASLANMQRAEARKAARQAAAKKSKRK